MRITHRSGLDSIFETYFSVELRETRLAMVVHYENGFDHGETPNVEIPLGRSNDCAGYQPPLELVGWVTALPLRLPVVASLPPCSSSCPLLGAGAGKPESSSVYPRYLNLKVSSSVPISNY